MAELLTVANRAKRWQHETAVERMVQSTPAEKRNIWAGEVFGEMLT
jgi:hypothetical protein